MKVETAAVVVTLRDSPRLRRTIASLRQDLAGQDAMIVCVLNNPGDSQTRDENGVRIVGAGMNLGWAGGMHAALVGVESEYLWCIQDDLVVPRGTHETLRGALQADPRLGSVRPLPVGDDGLVAQGSVTSTVNDAGEFSRPVPPHRVPPSEVKVSDGSFLPSSAQFVRRSAWDEVGGFDPWFYPWGFIDVDFGRSLLQAGWHFRTVPEAQVLHSAGGSTNQPFRALLAQRQASLYAAKWSSKPSALVHPHIIEQVREGRVKPRHTDLDSLRHIAGTCAADLVLFLMGQLPERLAAERAPLESHLADARYERDAALADLAFVTDQFQTAARQRDRAAQERNEIAAHRDRMEQSRAWRMASAFWRLRDSVLRRDP